MALWREFHQAEKSYLKCKRSDMGCSAIKRRFLLSQKKFDKELKTEKRSHERSKVYDLEKANVGNPNEFWNLMAKLGPEKPLESLGRSSSRMVPCLTIER